MRFTLSAFIIILLAVACGRDLPTLQGVDIEKWKNDKNACLGLRKPMESSLKTEMTKLKGLSETDIIKLLGRPDQNELYKRNQKFYYYYISAGPGCTAGDSSATSLVLRFNAMGFAQLVSIE